MQDLIHEKMRHMVPLVAESFGAEAEIDINKGVPVTYNDPELTKWAAPVLERVVGSSNLNEVNAITGAEDFAFFANEVPGFYYFIGGCPTDVNPAEAAPHHTPDFYVDDSGMKTGLMAMLNLAIEYSEKK